MTAPVSRILVIQTAFIGDVVLTLPIFQVLRREFPLATIDAVVIPRAADVLTGHPAISHVIIYDKRGRDRGIARFLHIVADIRRGGYDVAVVPHRSIRSVLLAWLGGIPRRIGFDRSSGRLLWTDTVRYRKEGHEIDRNLSLLEPLLGHPVARELPNLEPLHEDDAVVDDLLASSGVRSEHLIAIAPGTAWKTKQWPPERYADLCRVLVREAHGIVLIGGAEDDALCRRILGHAGSGSSVNTAGRLTLRQSAALLKRCRLLVCNDSAPMHLAEAVGTPVVAIFGATVPAFGFGPAGPCDVVLETMGLPCRPCSIHGGPECPIGTFDCMVRIEPPAVLEAVERIISAAESSVRR